MLSKKRIESIKDILVRISCGDEVSLKERLYINKIADEDQRVSAWLTTARRLQLEKKTININPNPKDPDKCTVLRGTSNLNNVLKKFV